MALKKIILILILVFSNLGYSTSSKIENHVSHAVIAPLITSFTPASGPKGTRVTITGSGFSATSQVNFNGFNAITVYINSTTLQAIVPLIASGENQTITVIDSGVSTNAATFFTLNTTLGTCASFTDLIISEVYDSGTGNVWYMELYNPTNTPIILNAPGSIYKLERYGSIGNPSPTRTIDLTGTVPPNSVYTLKLGNASPNTCNAITYNFTETGAGINEDDEIRLTKNGLPIDVVYCPDETGYTIKRNSNASGPSNIYDATEWTTLLSETCTDLGLFTVSNNLPTINSHPIDVTGCPSTATFAVAASATGILTYQWYYNNGTNTNWTLLTSVFPGVTLSGTASPSLSLSGNLTTLNGYQFYCAVSLNASCTIISNAATLAISSTTTPTFNQISPICPGQSFTLPSASNNSTAINGTWSPAINTTTTTTYTFTPTAGQCATTTTMTVVVNPSTTPTFTPIAPICSGQTFTLPTTSTNSTAIIGTWSPAINNTATTTYTFTPTAGQCATTTTMTIVINPSVTLSLTSVAGTDNQTVCTGNALIPIAYTFGGSATGATVTGLPAGITASTSGNVLTITGTPTAAFTYAVTTDGGCGSITLNGTVALGSPANLNLYCDSANSTPTALAFDFSNVGQTNFTYSYTIDGGAPITGTHISPSNFTVSGLTPGQVVVFTITANGVGCVPPETVSCTTSCPSPTLTDGAICVDEFGVPFQSYTLDSGLDNATYDFVWYFNGVAIPNSNNATYTANAVGTYGVIATNSVTNCVSSDVTTMVTANVTSVTPAASMAVTQSAYFSGNATLTVNVTGGSGTLMYSLDEGTLQSSNVFTNVSSGPHTITVIDTQGCTYLTYTLLVIDYPQYFTPNGDGINDTWYIAGLQNTDVINIFDRYGKLIKQLKGVEFWDGTYNQELLPSTDYWFTVDYLENGAKKQFKAHFAMKR